MSATQSPTKKTTPLSPSCTGTPDLEEYNSDASTDVEDNATPQLCPNLLKLQIPAHPSTTTSIPETPPHSSHNTTIENTSFNTSIPETPAESLPTTSKTETPVCSLPKIVTPETQVHSSPNSSLSITPVHSSISIIDTPTKAHKNDNSKQGPDNEYLLFKKPLASSIFKVSKSPNTPARNASSPKSSAFTKGCKVVSTQLFTADNPDAVDLDAPTQVFTNDASVDLDAPTQVFDNDVTSNVDLDAPTQVFDNDVTSSVDLDAPTQMFSNDTSIDLDVPTQVFTNDADLNACTQIFTPSDAPSGIDPDAPTQIFDNDTPSHIDFDAPTQVFDVNNTSSDIDPDAPTQVFTSVAPDDIDPDAPTQVFTNDAPDDLDPDAPTQVFTNDAPDDIDPNAPTQVFTSVAPDDLDPDAPTQVFTNDALGGIDPGAPTQLFLSDASGEIDPGGPKEVFTTDALGGRDGIKDRHVATMNPVASSSTPEVRANGNYTQKLASGEVRHTRYLGSTQLSLHNESVSDNTLSSQTPLCDPVDASVPAQPSLVTYKSVLGPSSSIMEAWGHLESNASLSTNTASVGHTGKEDLQESDAASDASKSLFNEEDEAESLHDEGEIGVFDSVKGHKQLKGEDFHSDESTDLEENAFTDPVPHTNHKVAVKIALSMEKEDPAAGCCENIERVMSDLPHNRTLEGNCEEVRNSQVTSSRSSRKKKLLTLTEQSIHSSSKIVRPHRQVAKRLPFIPSEPCTLDTSQETIPINVSLSDCYFDMSEENSECNDLTGARLPDWLSDSESEENAIRPSQKLFDLPSETEGDMAQRTEDVMITSTRRKSTRPSSNEGNTPKSSRKKVRVASNITPASCPLPSASAATPKHIHTKSSVSSSSTTTSNLISASTSTTTATSTTTPTSTASCISSQTSVPACAPVLSCDLSSITNGKTRRDKTEDETSISTTVSIMSPIPTRKRSNRSTSRDEVNPSSTTTSIYPTTATSATTVTTISTTDVITATRCKSLRDMRPKRRTPSQRVTVKSAVNTKSVETEELNESRASPQPSTSANAGTSNTSANTRSRRGKQETVLPIKVKVEMIEDENGQTTTLFGIKQEMKEIETYVCEQPVIKTEPKDDLAQDNLDGEGSSRSRRMCRRPERFSQEKDISLPGRKSKSKMSLPSSKSSNKVLRENTANVVVTITEESNTGSDVPARQRRSQRILSSMQSRTRERPAPETDLEVTTLVKRVKKEQNYSDEEFSGFPIPSCTTLTPEADPPPKKSWKSRASSSKGARQPSPRATKKIKIEIVPKEESEDNFEDSKSRITQSRIKQTRASKRLSPSLYSKQNTRRNNLESSEASSSNGSFSSRATRSNKVSVVRY